MSTKTSDSFTSKENVVLRVTRKSDVLLPQAVRLHKYPIKLEKWPISSFMILALPRTFHQNTPLTESLLQNSSRAHARAINPGDVPGKAWQTFCSQFAAYLRVAMHTHHLAHVHSRSCRCTVPERHPCLSKPVSWETALSGISRGTSTFNKRRDIPCFNEAR